MREGQTRQGQARQPWCARAQPEHRQALRGNAAALQHRTEARGIEALEKSASLDDAAIEKRTGLGSDRVQVRLIEVDVREPGARSRRDFGCRLHEESLVDERGVAQ